MAANLTLTYGSLNLTATPYLIEFGLDTGAPQNVYETLALLLQDGEVELSDRASNRTVQFNVLIEGANLTALATAEAALIAETDKLLNTITVNPGDGAPAGVYETFRGQVTLVRDDDWELGLLRRYTVTVKAYPTVRSATAFTSVALPTTGSTTTLLDACSATTGWSGLVNGGASSPSVVSGAVVVSAAADWGPYTISLQKTFAATTSSTKLLMVDWKPSVFGASLTATGDSVSLPLYAEGASPTSGFVRSWFFVAASSLAVTKFETTSNVVPSGADGAAPVRSLSIDNVAVTDVAPIVGTGRQQLRSIPLVGSARAPASLAVESATAALGNDAMVYVYKADESTRGYVPSVGQFQSAGTAPTTDTALVSGHKVSLGGAGITFSIPLALLPMGMYLLLLRLALSSGGGADAPVVYATSTVLGSNTVAPVSATTRTFGLTTTYTTFAGGRLMLPTVDVDPKTPATLKLVLSSTSADVMLDEAWLLNTSIGALTQVDCGTGAGAIGGAARRLWIEPASTTVPRPTVRIGHSADRSDAFYPVGAVDALQFPECDPPQFNALVVTPGATDAQISARYFPRWHTNPAQ